MIKQLTMLIALLMLAERAWKHWIIVRFFQRPVPFPQSHPVLVSILQPILSGDPTLPACLEHNLASPSTSAR
jgi:ceramide glucosyltransferase